METHVKVVAWLRIVLSAMGLIGSAIVLLVFGGVTLLMGSAGDAEAARVAPWISVFGALIAALVGGLSLPGIIVGWGVLTWRPWARVLNIVLSVLDLFAVPVGTVVGVYSLWVMFHPETVALFESPRLSW